MKPLMATIGQLKSGDVLRGLDMFMIIGFDRIARAPGGGLSRRGHPARFMRAHRGLILLLSLAVVSAIHAENIVFPPGIAAVVDVTQPPYGADHTGRNDCTAAIVRAMDDVLAPDRAALQETMALVKHQREQVHRADQLTFEQRQQLLRENPKTVIGFERCSGTFPYRNPPSRILYFPNGTYLVSDTLTYSFRDLQNASGMEFNRCLHLQGQSERGTIIRLRDHAPGFGRGANKPVVSFTRGTRSNVAMQNTCENLTIDVGDGNPGAIGLLFFANNTGAARHLTLRSSDPQGAGRSGLAVTTDNSSCAFIQHVSVEGFDVGIDIDPPRLYTVLERLTLRGQKVAGLRLGDHNVAVRRLISHNSVPAVRLEGTQATMALLDSVLGGGNGSGPALDLRAGFLFARNVDTRGYGCALECASGKGVAGPRLAGFLSHPGPVAFAGPAQRSLNLPVEETPEVPWEADPSQWVSVNEFGARGDGLTDDTEALQKALYAGKPVIYFQPGSYVIDAPVSVPSHVQRIHFLYCDLVAGGNLQRREGQGAFRITGESERALLIEKLFAGELFFGAHYLIDHACRRTLVLRDLHTQVGAMYRNSVPGGKVFLENVCSTDQFAPQRNCFSFVGQQVWARQLNPERANPQVRNQGSQLWVLGFKTEGSGTAFETTQGGRTEVLGGIFNLNRAADSAPTIVTRDSRVSVFASTTDHRRIPIEWNRRPVAEETRHEVTRQLLWDQFPKRDAQLIVVPLECGAATEE